jgi:hypothetical protein
LRIKEEIKIGSTFLHRYEIIELEKYSLQEKKLKEIEINKEMRRPDIK